MAPSLAGQAAFLPEQQVAYIALDPLGQLYVLEANGRLSIQNSLSSQDFSFEDSRLGLPDALDVGNPLGPLLYFSDYQTLLLLDRTLHVNGQLDLRSHPKVQQPSCFARSFNDQIWLYDAWDYRLKLLNASGEVLRESLDLRQRLNILSAPSKLRVVGELLFVSFPDGRLATFNFLGRFLGWESLAEAEQQQWTPQGLLGWTPQGAWRWNGSELQSLQVPAAALTAQQLIPWQGGWLARMEEKLFFFANN